MSSEVFPSGIRAVLLDLDETLLDDDRGMRAAVGLVGQEIASRDPSINIATFVNRYMRESNEFWGTLGAVPTSAGQGADGLALRVTLWERVLAVDEFSGLLTGSEAADLYSSARRQTYALFDDVIPFLAAASRRWTLGILTNGAGNTQREKISVTGIDQYVSHVFVSGEMGVGKPDKAAFNAALRGLGAEPQETAHIGDSFESDVQGAVGSGVFPVWLRRGTVAPEYSPGGVLTISSLSELLR